MCEGWWAEARNADERCGMQARGTKQRELVEDTSRELPWIESGSLVRDFWSAVVPEFLGRLKARGHALMAKWGQDILLRKNGKQKDFSSLSSWMQWQWQWSLELCQRWQPQTSATGNVISWNLGLLTWYTCSATLHRTGHAKESSNCNAAGDPDSPRKQV